MLLREVMVHEQSSMVRVVAAVTVMVWEPAVTTVAAGQKVVRLEDDGQHDVLRRCIGIGITYWVTTSVT